MYSHLSKNVSLLQETGRRWAVLQRIHALVTQGLLIALMALTPAGCAFMGAGPVIQAPASIHRRAIVASVPFFPQKKYQCGPAALAMVLRWSGIDTTPDELVSSVYLPGRKGSLQSGLIAAARRRGRLAYPFRGISHLIEEVAAGHPVVVLQNLGLSWLPRWHYAVVAGYDLDERYVVLHTGDKAERQVGLRTFMYTWKRADQWGLSVLTPGSMPACAEEQPYLEAVFGLQQADGLKAALPAFEAAARHWPGSADAYLFLGNAYYSAGSRKKALMAFLQAVHLDPGNGIALNNLANLLAESGELNQAEMMARRAVAIGGIHLDAYRDTLKQIEMKRSAVGTPDRKSGHNGMNGE